MEKGPGFSRIIRKIRVSGLILKTPEIRELKARKKARINFSLPGCQTLRSVRTGASFFLPPFFDSWGRAGLPGATPHGGRRGGGPGSVSGRGARERFWGGGKSRAETPGGQKTGRKDRAGGSLLRPRQSLSPVECGGGIWGGAPRPRIHSRGSLRDNLAGQRGSLPLGGKSYTRGHSGITLPYSEGGDSPG